ncbi:MAG: glycoside hydrolase family 27 protein [Acidobacteria bacterium]|nr:glycoside hydrolase family 27 protein [Acidobacteriota bacterium]
MPRLEPGGRNLGIRLHRSAAVILRLAVFPILLFGWRVPAAAQSPAPLPPMGWNSWDAYGTTVTEEQVKANAEVLARELSGHGWRYVVVDIQWYEPNAEGHDYRPGARLSLDGYGRLIPAVNRFPSSAGGRGFKPLADYLHDKGLKFGIHIMRGIPRQAVEANLPIERSPYRAADVAEPDNPCRWNPDMWGVDMTKPGSQAYYDSIAQLYATWGIDFIKADDMGSHLYQPAEIKALSRALHNTGRPIVLSISPGPAPISEAEFFEKYADLWRISDDFWDDWRLLKKQFDYTREWASYVGKHDTWPDADMLPLGRLRVTGKEGGGTPSRFTADEQQTLMSLWCMFRSPLIFGGDLPTSDAATIALMTNDEVLAIDQHSSGNHQSLEDGNLRVWIADAPDGTSHYVAVFNIGDSTQHVSFPWHEAGIKAQTAAVRNLWTKQNLGKMLGVELELRAHASVLYRISELE